MTEEKKKLGAILIEKGVIDRHQLLAALERQKSFDKKLGETLADMGFISEIELTKILGEYFRVPAIEVDKFPAEPKALALVKAEFCEKHDLIPIALRSIKGQTKLVVVTADPSDIKALDELKFVVNVPLAIGVADLSSVRKAIKLSYRGGRFTPRDEITITTTVRPEDAVLEIIRAGGEEKIEMPDITEVRPTSLVVHDLVQLLVSKGILTPDEAKKLRKG
ncbi:MAG: hypothetical protein V1798_09905 [Pseudomonadota bacterium]